MAPIITNLQPTTELEAINSMLSAIGETPVTILTGTLAADVQMALNILRNETREVLSMGWRFNSEAGVPLKSAATVAWLDTTGATTTLNVFTKPAGALVAKQSLALENGDLDLVERPSKQYKVAGNPVLILYDRTRNRDGSADKTTVYLDVIWAYDFEQCPEVARKYILQLAVRRFCKEILGSDTLVGFTQEDTLLALRNLKREEGETEDLNIMDTLDAHGIMGRTRIVSGGAIRRVYP